MFKVLSIDGGGIRGVIPAVLLEHIEEKTKKSVADLFDLIVGTSTGGILAAALTNKPGQRRWQATEMVGLYSNRGRDIFKRSPWRVVSSLGGMADERYDHVPLEKLLTDYLGDSTLADCDPPIVVTSYDIEQRKPYFFKTMKARCDAARNHYLRDVARATSAGPTYFEPTVVGNIDTVITRRVLVDGGVFVNNPAMCAYVEARTSFVKEPLEILLVSLDTGKATRPIPYEDAKDWGALSWVHPLVSIMMDGTSDAVHYHLKHLLRSENSETRRYFRFKTKLEYGSDDMDDVSVGNIRNLKAKAKKIIEEKSGEFECLAKLLLDDLSTATPDTSEE